MHRLSATVDLDGYLASFQIDGQHGFLPAQDPLTCLPPEFAAWERLAGALPALLVAGQLADNYNRCLLALDRFRQKHMEIAITYVSRQAPAGAGETGTGGTNLGTFLAEARKATRNRLLG